MKTTIFVCLKDIIVIYFSWALKQTLFSYILVH